MIWSTCWISLRSLHFVAPMISSTTQRLIRKTCGLFDSGIAGGAKFITSPGLNAPADFLADFGLGGHDSTSLNPGVSGIKSFSEELKEVNGWDVLDDLEDLSGDPLGDDSMEAFINLDQFLNGNSLFDEDDNLIVPNEEEAQVNPVINFALEPENFISEAAVPNFTMVQEDETSQNIKPAAKRSSRKRSYGSVAGVKTSLYEIPATSVTTEIVHTDTELDHDYSSKHQRMSSPLGNKSEIDTMKIFAQNKPDLPVPGTSSSDNNLILNESLDKQTVRRIKNNHASKRSREQRKQKFVDMDLEAEELILRNQELREKIEELEQLAQEMKKMLVAKMAGK